MKSTFIHHVTSLPFISNCLLMKGLQQMSRPSHLH